MQLINLLDVDGLVAFRELRTSGPSSPPCLASFSPLFFSLSLSIVFRSRLAFLLLRLLYQPGLDDLFDDRFQKDLFVEGLGQSVLYEPSRHTHCTMNVLDRNQNCFPTVLFNITSCFSGFWFNRSIFCTRR